MVIRLIVLWAAAAALSLTANAQYDYRVLATNKTSTMEKEMNEAADAGYFFRDVMGGETGFGGKEVVVIMAKDLSGISAGRKQYKLLATSRTGTMQKEIQQAGDEGFEYLGQTVFDSTFGGREVSVILERNLDAPPNATNINCWPPRKPLRCRRSSKRLGKPGSSFWA